MKTRADNNIQQAESPGKRGDPAPLVDFIRESIERRIEEVNAAAESEISGIDSGVQGEIEEFREIQRLKYEEAVKREGGKIKNLSSTGIKKQKLEGTEAFINRVISAAAAAVRLDERYPEFLVRCVASGLENVRGSGVTILLSQEDLRYSDLINKMITASGYEFKVKVVADDRAMTGGAMVLDDEAEVIYNNTVERILYRRRDEIRREIAAGLIEAAGGTEG